MKVSRPASARSIHGAFRGVACCHARWRRGPLARILSCAENARSPVRGRAQGCHDTALDRLSRRGGAIRRHRHALSHNGPRSQKPSENQAFSETRPQRFARCGRGFAGLSINRIVKANRLERGVANRRSARCCFDASFVGGSRAWESGYKKRKHRRASRDDPAWASKAKPRAKKFLKIF